MLPWLIVAVLGGVIVGLILGVLLAQALVRGHYTHVTTNQQAPLAQPRPREYRSPNDHYYTERLS
jgi:hypothetical protein